MFPTVYDSDRPPAAATVTAAAAATRDRIGGLISSHPSFCVLPNVFYLDYPLNVSIDSGANVSYVSEAFCKRHNILPGPAASYVRCDGTRADDLGVVSLSLSRADNEYPLSWSASYRVLAGGNAAYPFDVTIGTDIASQIGLQQRWFDKPVAAPSQPTFREVCRRRA